MVCLRLSLKGEGRIFVVEVRSCFEVTFEKKLESLHLLCLVVESSSILFP